MAFAVALVFHKHSLFFFTFQKALAECAVYLARAPKSVEVYMAYNRAKACVWEHKGPLPSVPLHLRNASNKFMKNLGNHLLEFLCSFKDISLVRERERENSPNLRDCRVVKN